MLGLILGPVGTQSHTVATALPIERLFPTQVYRASLAGRDANALQQRLSRGWPGRSRWTFAAGRWR